MNKRIFIIHSWDGYPEEGWFPWLKQELTEKGFQVQIPAMPEPAEPKIEAWVSHLAKVVGDVDENTFLLVIVLVANYSSIFGNFARRQKSGRRILCGWLVYTYELEN